LLYRYTAPTGLGKRRGFLVPTGIPILRGWEKGVDSLFYRYDAAAGTGKKKGM